MASITTVSRCAGLNHVTIVASTSVGNRTFNFLIGELTGAAPLGSEEYQRQRLALLVREAQAAGNVSFAQIKAYLEGRSFVE